MTQELEQTVSDLSTEAALKTIDADPYWPKWNSPWWKMLLLHEMGEAARIPDVAVRRFVAALDRYPLKIFPILSSDMPADVDPFRGTPCHCQLGTVYQVLAARGVDVDRELPWIRPWFLRYQMADGGLNCDNDAYLVKNECPSSMVGTIGAFEAILRYTDRPWTAEEKSFLDRAARFLINRRLTRGSWTAYNAAERKSAENWVKLCFPRFYFYDVLRGLDALTLWAEKTGENLPQESVEEVVTLLSRQSELKPERVAFAGAGTLLQDESGAWVRNPKAMTFPLLETVSAVGHVSPFLSRQWEETQRRLRSMNRLG